MSSPCPVVPNRHPYAIEMLERVFKMSVRDYDVLALCGFGPIAMWQCHANRLESARNLERRGLLMYSFRWQQWTLTVAGQAVLDAIPGYLAGYVPAEKERAPVIEFPSPNKATVLQDSAPTDAIPHENDTYS